MVIASPTTALMIAGAISVLSASAAQAQGSRLWFSCDTKAREMAMTALKEAVPTADGQSAALSAATAAIAKAEALDEATLAGADVPPPYSSASFWVQRASTASTPEVADLFRRVAKDQLIRFSATIAQTHAHWARGLSDPALGYAYRIVALKGCGVDEANTAWLRERVATHGWFTISAHGPEADQAAFVLIQHADRNPAFQAEMLAKLEKLVQTGETRPLNYAMLFDRVAMHQGRPQRYGSQGRCTGDGHWTAFETEDPATLDQRRASVGLQPHADYVAQISASACKRG